jgi:ADP-heptose:LPS heptosyltransferase
MPHSAQWISGVKKIAVLRANALGDFIFAQPALEALRAAYPRAEIVLLGKAWHADYLRGRPGPVDRVEVVPPYRGVSEPDTWPGPDGAGEARIDEFFARMQSERFDLAIQMHGGGGNSNPFVRRLGARVSLGLRAPGAPALDRWMPYLYWQPEVMRFLELVNLAEAPPVTVEPHIAVTPADREAASLALSEDGRPLVVLHPGASDPRRRWAPERFAAVGSALLESGYALALVGIPSEREVVDAVLRAMPAALVPATCDLCGALSLQALTGLLARAALVIGNDSGPRHLAEAVGAPTVGIYWCGNLINAGPATRTFHRPHLSWRLNCPVCGQNTLYDPCQHQASFCDEVQVADVLESALDLLRLSAARA